ncbi:lysoplasmalogenase [Micromonospora soli]|uniref:lysoplasmalogenase n=1 Tax=Micromonospora sp. NBRC 110009 TaxID=3061627 RepID=UPI0026716F60|nr:lysoplasmalogenase [Micromonospora sp. NBRC 110009]WKT98110.1 lysoplasmalogenase [Micromonospora sp. NBRC 110009]
MRRPWLALFGVAVAVELVGVALDATPVQWLAKPLLAPLLLAYLWSVRRRVDGVAVGLVFATAGDVALLVPRPAAFLVGMGCFLVTQLGFLTAFLRHRRPPVPAVVGYLLTWAAANALLWSPLGPLRLPVLGYSLALSLMAAAAAGVSRRTAAGGAFFLVSDLLIGAGAAGVDLPGAGLLVMSTYSAALLLITTGSARVRTVGSPRRSGGAGRSAQPQSVTAHNRIESG